MNWKLPRFCPPATSSPTPTAPPTTTRATRTHLPIAGLTESTADGIIGRSPLADATKGKAALEGLTQSFADHLSTLGR
ncbi:hypothetical protein [Nocardia sp. CA-290969]|uniref:hypothetical protein n=1 Tax=Nocardia sp. CA-290969 TaxID=3239986 RepID=UPI003D8D7596